MLTPARALLLASESDPIPSVPELVELDRLGFRPRRGQLTMIVGQPGALKSTFALWWAWRTDLKTLYFSADMDAHDAVTRLTACVTGEKVNAVSEALDLGAEGLYEDVLDQLNIQFCFDSAPTLDDIADEVAAYVELRDAFPEIIVIDNVMNVESEMGEQHAGLHLVMKEAHRLARTTQAAVFVLHHMREEGSSADIQPRSGIAGKIAQLPERILGVAFDGMSDTFRFYPLKNRGGKADPSGHSSLYLSAMPEKATFGAYTYPTWGGYTYGQES